MSVLDWASGVGRRASAVALEITGFVAGTPVTAELLNDVIGRITDWIRRQQSGVVTLLPGALVWRAGGQGSITNSGSITLTLDNNGTGTANAATLPFYGDKVSPAFRVGIGSIDDDTNISVLVTSPGATSLSRYAATATPSDADSTVTLAYAPQSAPLDGPDVIAPGDSLGISVALNGLAGDAVTITMLEIDFS